MNIDEWILRFSDRRYGFNKDLRLAWQMLVDSVFSPAQGGGSHVVAYEPNLNQRAQADYLDVFSESMRLYLKAAREMDITPVFRHDFVDLARELVADLFAEVNSLFRSSLDRCVITGKKLLICKGS